jgi:protein-disulfide isomerase
VISRTALLLLGGLAALPLTAQAPLGPRTKGNADAAVTVYEMSDFQCPFCERFTRETFPIIEREYIQTGKVRWIFVNFPLTSLHPNALPAAEFASCAAKQDRFWPAHDMLYATQREWASLPDPGAFFAAKIAGLGLNRASMLQCLQSGETRTDIRLDAEGAVRSGAGSTPAFYIEGGMMEGAHPVAVFRTILDSIVAAKRRPS